MDGQVVDRINEMKNAKLSVDGKKVREIERSENHRLTDLKIKKLQGH